MKKITHVTESQEEKKQFSPIIDPNKFSSFHRLVFVTGWIRTANFQKIPEKKFLYSDHRNKLKHKTIGFDLLKQMRSLKKTAI